MLTVGTGSIVINGKIGAPIQGATVNQVAKRVRDDLEANAVMLADDDTEVLFISCDLIGPRTDFIRQARKRIAAATGIPERGVIIASTHTHAGPCIAKGPIDKPVDVEYLDSLAGWLVELAVEARESARPARIGWNSGRAKIGYNRRTCYADGSHEMHGTVFRDDFTGMEGPEDDGHYVLCAVDEDDRPIVIVHANTSHPTSFYGADFFSADYPGASRQFLRSAFGEIPIVYLNGTFGDTGPQNRFSQNRVLGRESQMLQQAHLVTGETMRQIYAMPFHDEVPFKHAFEDLAIPFREPDPDDVRLGLEFMDGTKSTEGLRAMDWLIPLETARLYKYMQDNPIETVSVHAIRVGDFAIVTQPCELFTQFGLDIKRRSPSSATAICGMADGCSGYCPTVAGILGGGFSGRTILSCRLSHDAGYRIVDSACQMLHGLWTEG